MLKVKVVWFSQGGFEAFNYLGCDGHPAQKCFDVVYVTVEDGREFFLPRGERVQDEDGLVGYRARYDLARMEARVVERGTIDPAYWVELEPQPSLRERLADAWEEEQRERMGWGG
jgi:hypothetical protein